MSVQGFKNLINRSLLNDDSFQPLLKKSDQYRRLTQGSIDYFQLISRNFETFSITFDKSLFDLYEELESSTVTIPQYYHEYIQLFRNMNAELKMFSDKVSNNFKELTSLCSNLFSSFSNLILTFQNHIRNYKAHETILFELSKKYLRTHKNMITNLQSYKNSFTDVRLIYNMDQKIKRFTQCEGNFKNLNQELAIITQKSDSLSQEKQAIIEIYKSIQKQLVLTLKSIGSKFISQTRSFVWDYCQMQKIVITYLAERKFTLEKIELKTFFAAYQFNDQEIFSIAINREQCLYLPTFIVHHKHLKEEHLPQLNKLLSIYLKQTVDRIEKRKLLNKKIHEFTSNYFKIYQKTYYFNFKESVTTFDKMKKKIGQIFGSKLISFLKSINSIFELSIGINEKLVKHTITKIKNIENYINQENKLLDLFLKQLKGCIDKFVKRKEGKKPLIEKQQDQFTQQEPSVVDLQVLRSEISSKSQYLIHLTDGFVEKMKKNYDQIKFQYNALINDISLSANQYYSLCCEYHELYFGDDQFMKNYKKYQSDIEKSLLQETTFFQEINFSLLLKESQGKILFDSQLNKVEEFKKLKKPIEINLQEVSTENGKENKSNLQRKSLIVDQEQQIEEKEDRKLSKLKSAQSLNQPIQNINQTDSVAKENSKDNSKKYEDFINSKITFLSDEKFFKSFSCGLSDKIILTGRLYITNKRLCFHSKFNPSTVFFGDTFIQIPKKDIRKVQKRTNAIVFDNSISITTVNGEVFLTSFFSRNEAFDLILKALQINAEEQMFEPQQLVLPNEQQSVVPAEDDMKSSTLVERLETINKSLTVFEYKTLLKSNFSSPGLNALKFFKLFDLGQELSYNRKVYKSFTHYFKQCLEHKNQEIDPWVPSVNEYLNSTDIKDNTPISFTKKIFCIVPVPNSGVPFMPKQAKSNENLTLYIYSKDKYVLESVIQNSGVPYSDTFNLRMRKIIETTSQDTCTLTVQFFVNFVSNTMMKGMIESKSAQESKLAMMRYEEEVKKYLKFLQKAKSKSKQLTTSNNIQDSKQINEQQQSQVKQLEQQNKNLKIKLQNLSNKFSKGKQILIGSVILNMLFIILLFH